MKETVQDVLNLRRKCWECFVAQEAEQDPNVTCDPCGWELEARRASALQVATDSESRDQITAQQAKGE